MQGDLYEYMLGKLATAGQNGQFRTPRHIIDMMVELLRPTPEDTICEKTLSTLIQRPVSFESGLNWFQPCASFESGFTFAQ